MDIMINAALFFSLLALSSYVYAYILKKERVFLISSLLLLFSWLLSAAHTAIFSFKAGRLPLSNQYESVLLLTQFILMISLYVYFFRELKPAFILPAAVLAPALFSLLNLLDPAVRPLMPALRSNWLFFHVFTAMLAYSFFAIAGLRGLFYFVKKEIEKEDYCIKLVKAGFVMLTIAIITGAIWAENAWNRYWSWDPKETWSLICWLYYAALLHMKRTGFSAKTFYMSLFIGLLIVVFTYFGVNYLLSGLHSYA